MSSLMWLLLLASAGAAVAVTWLPQDAENITVLPVHRPASAVRPADVLALGATATSAAPAATTPALTTPTKPLASLSPTRDAWPGLSPSARQAWTPPPPAPAPPPPPVVVPPPAPPPAFPYQWLGQVEEEGRVRVFLANPQRTLAVGVGEVLDQRWRVDGTDAGRLLLTWLPTHTAVTVAAR